MMNSRILIPSICTLAMLFAALEPIHAQQLRGFETDTGKRSIDLNELIDGGPSKDGINNSPFLLRKDVSDEISPMEKVVGVRTESEVKGFLSRYKDG